MSIKHLIFIKSTKSISHNTMLSMRMHVIFSSLVKGCFLWSIEIWYTDNFLSSMVKNNS